MPLKYQEAIEHDHIPSPPPKQIKIWRFMSLPKFLNLLTTHSLHFTQMEVLRNQDPYEGRFTKLNKELDQQILQDQAMAKAFYGENYERMKPHLVQQHGEQNRTISEKINTTTNYVNCWHIAEHEPAGLWKLYSNEHEGVAISSNLGRFDRAFAGTEEWIYPGKIEYVDYEAALFSRNNGFAPIFKKRLHFSSEQELRLCTSVIEGAPIYPNCLNNPKGILVKCGVEELIDQVIVGPACEDWIYETLEKLISTMGFSLSLQKSKILSAPE